jgi:hypothetical protein
MESFSILLSLPRIYCEFLLPSIIAEQKAVSFKEDF